MLAPAPGAAPASRDFADTPRLGQYPGYEMKLGQTDGREAVLV